MSQKRYINMLVALIFTVVLLGTYTSQALATVENGLVSVQWLSKHLKDKDVVVLDVRTFPKYIKSHIPGAVRAFGPWQTMNEKFIGFMTPPISTLQEQLRNYGVSNDSFVVIYDQGLTSSDTSKSARALWTLHYLGHINCAILDGGFNAWEQAELPITTKPAIPDKGNFQAVPVLDKVISLDEVKKKLKDRSAIFVDLRQPHEHFGHEKKSFIPRYGHLPCSLLMPAAYITIGGQNFSPAFLRKKAELEEMAAGVGIPKDKAAEIIVYSNVGTDAALGYFVLTNILGYKNVRLFDGSILEASKDPSVPMNRYSWGWTECK